MNERVDNLIEIYKNKFSGNPDIIVRAPGRVNLIGEHTDYNDGFVFPVAIDRDIMIALKKRDDQMVRLYSMDLDASNEFSLDNIQFDSVNTWSNYLRGVAHFLIEDGYNLTGMDAVITGNIPIGAGLSSSAAMEVATAMAFENICEWEIEPPQMALLCQKAENKFVGVNCGIMDQFISRMGKKDNALLLDCRTLSYELVPLNLDTVKIVVCNTGKKRGLVDSEYNARRSECEKGVKILEKFLPGIEALRDIDINDLIKYKSHIPEITEKRCRYVIKENDRVIESVEALAENDLIKFGELMNQSHIGLRDEYEVSCPELDTMVDIAWSIDGVIGSRMTGAGFGGCTVSLVVEDSLEDFINIINEEYPKRTGLQHEIYVCSVEDGAGVVMCET
ncbi:TPA: galactokinase [bacterium]|nr:galactokinase [bacterium]